MTQAVALPVARLGISLSHSICTMHSDVATSAGIVNKVHHLPFSPAGTYDPGSPAYSSDDFVPR